MGVVDKPPGEARRPATPLTPAAAPLLPALTGLRFFAALWVVFYHYALSLVGHGPPQAFNALSRGSSAVPLFFILSGFILTHTYVHQDGRFRGRASHFLRARGARIYPVYVLAFLVAMPIAFQHMGINATSITRGIYTLLLIQAWSPYWVSWWNAPSWSLSAEVFFYLSFPLLVRILRGSRLRTLACLSLLLCAINIAFPLYYLVRQPDGTVYQTHPLAAYWYDILNYHPLTHLPEFILGIVAYVSLVPPMPIAALNNAVLDPLFALLILGLSSSNGAIHRFLSCRSIVRLGEASYALYILHYSIWPLLQETSGLSPARAAASPLFFVYYLVLSCGIALAVYTYIEQPCRRLLRPTPSPSSR